MFGLSSQSKHNNTDFSIIKYTFKISVNGPGGGGSCLFIPVLGRQRQADVCEFEVNLVYTLNNRTVRDTQRNHVLEINGKKMFPATIGNSTHKERVGVTTDL